MLRGQSKSRQRGSPAARDDRILDSWTSELEQWPGDAASQPYIERGGDDSSGESDWEDLPELPGMYLTDLGRSGVSVTWFELYGSDLDITHSVIGIANVLQWKGHMMDVAFYERSCPKQPVWKLVGVYPVVDGFAQLDLKAVEGKGQTEDTALYIVPGGWLNKLPGWGWPSTIEATQQMSTIEADQKT